MLRHCNKNFSTENRNTPLLLLCMKFFDIRNFLKHKGSSRKWFGTVRQNNFEGKLWYPPPLIFLTFFVNWIFLKQRGSLTKFFGTLRQKIFDGNSWYYLPPSSPLINETFWYLKFSETQGFSYEVFRYWERQKNRPKIAIPLLSL